MKPTLELAGAKELEAALMGLKAVAAKAIVRPIMRGALKPVAQDAAARVKVKTGRLKRTIGIGFRLTKRQRKTSAKFADFEAFVGPGLANKEDAKGWRHAHLVEFGTSHSAPQPYMRPAWQQNIQAVFNGLAAGMSKALEKIAKKKARNGGR
jgi:HK97 gp10 family phage protein